MLARSPLHGAATTYLKSQIHLDDLVDTKRGFFSLRLWEWDVNEKEFHLLHYLGSSRLKGSPHSRAHSSHLLALTPSPQFESQTDEPRKRPLKLNQTEHCPYHLRVICSHEAYVMQNHVKGDTLINSAVKKQYNTKLTHEPLAWLFDVF